MSCQYIRFMAKIIRTQRAKNASVRSRSKKPVKKAVKLSLGVRNVKTLTLKLVPQDELSGLSISVSLGDAKLLR